MEITADHVKVWKLIKDIHIALLVTRAGNRMHARPMATIDRKFDGEIWFFTSLKSPKIQEIENDPHVLLSYAEPRDQTYISLQGTADIVKDRGKAQELWSEPVRIWFPDGVDDPDLTLLRVRVESAEYWDRPSASLVLLYDYAKARLTGQSPKSGEIGENRKVAF